MGSLAARKLVPELLDTLPHDHPEAQRSRKDIRRINALSFAAPILASRMRRLALARPRRMLDIGCGDGRMVLAVARRLSGIWPGVTVTLLDQQTIVSQRTIRELAALGWTAAVREGDLREVAALGHEPFDITVANLVLHHFDDASLAALLARIAARSRLFVASEPRRHGVTLAASQALVAIGANRVTRHDAPASVRAGFRTGELATLWPEPGAVLEDRSLGPFTHIFAARGICGAAERTS